MQIQINDPSVKSEEAHNGRVRDELFPNTYYLHKKLVARVKDTDSCERIWRESIFWFNKLPA